MGYLVPFNVYPSVIGTEIYRKITVPYNRNRLPPLVRLCSGLHSRWWVQPSAPGVRLHVAALAAMYCSTRSSIAPPSNSSPTTTLHSPVWAAWNARPSTARSCSDAGSSTTSTAASPSCGPCGGSAGNGCEASCRYRYHRRYRRHHHRHYRYRRRYSGSHLCCSSRRGHDLGRPVDCPHGPAASRLAILFRSTQKLHDR